MYSKGSVSTYPHLPPVGTRLRIGYECYASQPVTWVYQEGVLNLKVALRRVALQSSTEVLLVYLALTWCKVQGWNKYKLEPSLGVWNPGK